MMVFHCPHRSSLTLAKFWTIAVKNTFSKVVKWTNNFRFEFFFSPLPQWLRYAKTLYCGGAHKWNNKVNFSNLANAIKLFPLMYNDFIMSKDLWILLEHKATCKLAIDRYTTTHSCKIFKIGFSIVFMQILIVDASYESFGFRFTLNWLENDNHPAISLRLLGRRTNKVITQNLVGYGTMAFRWLPALQ